MGYCFSGVRSAGGVSSSPNPWSRSGARLKTPPKGAGEKVLFELAKIIRDWPRGKTATLSDEERHLRFILAVAGYPEIDVATRPLDWPLHAKSVEAMEVSKILDDIIGMHESTSLRSSLLNRDLNYRNEKLEELQSAHNDCLLLLFERTRKLDQFEEGEPKENGGDRDVPYFRPGEEALLTHLHSNDNRRRKWWPKLQELEDYKNVIPREMTKPEKPQTKHKFGSVEFEQWRDDKHEPWKAEMDLWRQFQNKEKHGRFSLQELEMQEVAFQFHHVQSWIDEVVPIDSELEGTVQRFLRGASLMLELVISEVRQRIAHKVGIGSITVDGGGRIVFLCPADEIEKRKIMEKLESASIEFLGVDRAVSRARNNVRFEETIRNWGKAGMNLGKKLDEISEEDLLEAKRGDYEKWFGQIRSKLTPISTPKSSAREDSPNSIEAVVGLLEKFPSPRRIVVNDKSEDDCWFCNVSFFDGCADGAEREKKAEQIDSLMGLEGKGEPSKNICQFHRLLYFIGHDQRLRDSTLRPPTDSDEISHKDDGGQRMVTAIARMDGNSLGILFRVDSEQENVPWDILVDRKRRRSFRFNSFWWQSLQRSVDEFGTGDRVAAWVTAGDDVILAQYDAVVRQRGKEPAVYRGREDKLLEKTLGSLMKKVGHWKDLEGDELFLSIGAGLAIKRPKSNSGENDRIRSQLHRSNHLEHLAKNRWKTRAQDKWPKMLKKPHGEKVEFDEDEGATEDWIHTYSTMVVDKKDLDLGKKKGEDLEVFVKEDFIGWTPELVTQIIELYGLEGDPARVYGVLKRHYIEIEGGRGRLKVLPPKKRGM